MQATSVIVLSALAASAALRGAAASPAGGVSTTETAVSSADLQRLIALSQGDRYDEGRVEPLERWGIDASAGDSSADWGAADAGLGEAAFDSGAYDEPYYADVDDYYPMEDAPVFGCRFCEGEAGTPQLGRPLIAAVFDLLAVSHAARRRVMPAVQPLRVTVVDLDAGLVCEHLDGVGFFCEALAVASSPDGVDDGQDATDADVWSLEWPTREDITGLRWSEAALPQTDADAARPMCLQRLLAMLQRVDLTRFVFGFGLLSCAGVWLVLVCAASAARRAWRMQRRGEVDEPLIAALNGQGAWKPVKIEEHGSGTDKHLRLSV